VRRCYKVGDITAAHCRQFTNFSNGFRRMMCCYHRLKLHGPAALSAGDGPMMPTGWEAGRTPEPVAVLTLLG
jgi:hypothetical protein